MSGSDYMGDLRSAASGKAAMIRLATKSGQHPECLNRSGGHGWGCGTGRAEMDKGERARRWSHECCTPKRIFSIPSGVSLKDVSMAFAVLVKVGPCQL